jgi:GntR family transcriptional regulator/MocR family aminotransferase
MHAVLELPPGWDEDDIIERARTRGLALEGLGAYGTLDGTRPPALIIGYGTPPAHAYTAALARLGATLAGLR